MLGNRKRTPFVFALVLFLGACATGPEPSRRFHVVKAGEELEDIAESYGMDETAFAMVNKLDPNKALVPGQALYIPYGYERLIEEAIAEREEPSAYELEQLQLAPVKFVLPLKKETKVTSFFGWRKRRMHEGIDLRARTGDLVVASAPGKVILGGRRFPGYGRMVVIDHGQGWSSVYAHNSKVLVKPGQVVKAGEVIAKAGRTGRANGPHLHFEIRRGADPLDPLLFLYSSRYTRAD